MADMLADDAPAPRLCHLIKWPDFDGYGFNLHAERSNPGQFIGKIDDDSPAQMAGLREGDRIIEVNGINISNENHRQVVERIKSDPNETRLLVVDQEADLWYREQDLVVKSSQLNVVYIKTPVPRPQPDSPRAKFHAGQPSGEPQAPANGTGANQIVGQHQQASSAPSDTTTTQLAPSSLSPSTMGASSLETASDDFNDDSIEQAAARAQQEHGERRPSPPMSPDSGKGDDAPEPAPAATNSDSQSHLVTVEAEINRQSPLGRTSSEPPANEDQSQCQIEKQKQKRQDNEEEEEVVAAASVIKSNEEEASQVANGPRSAGKTQMASQAAEIQPDSLQSAGQPGKVEEEKDISPKVHKLTGSADSGQSSSPDTSSSSGNESIADSLEDRSHQQHEPVEHKQVESRLGIHNNNNNNKDGRLEQDERVIKNVAATKGDKMQTMDHAAKSYASTNELVLSEAGDQQNSIDSETTTTTNKTNRDIPQVELKTKQQQPTAHHKVANINNNNYSGLNLNMTASEMRELIASRKKFDPKKAQMNIRQKYEIIQQM